MRNCGKQSPATGGAFGSCSVPPGPKAQMSAPGLAVSMVLIAGAFRTVLVMAKFSLASMSMS
jgi:hypothetical protein